MGLPPQVLCLRSQHHCLAVRHRLWLTGVVHRGVAWTSLWLAAMRRDGCKTSSLPAGCCRAGNTAGRGSGGDLRA